VKTNDLKTAVTPEMPPIAIIGIGCMFPGAENSATYWANIREGIDSITEIPSTHWKISDYFNSDPKSPDHTYGKRGGFLSPFPFNPLEFNIPPNTLEAIDTSQLLGLVVAGQALKDAGYGTDREYDKSRVSVILGVTGALELVIPLGARLGHPIWRKALKEAGVNENVTEDVVERISESYVQWQENSFPGLLGNVAAGRISKHYDFGGTNCVVDAACASSLGAIHLASMELASGKSNMVVTGGIDTFNDIFMFTCFSKTPALSPTGNAKPFDINGDGTILGEGLGIVVLKRLADAERDGDKIYALIRGIGSSSDGKGDAIYAPSSAGQKRALIDAYERGGVEPKSIGMVEAHGTGTKVGDAVEVSALRELYGEAETPIAALGSVKSQIGHTKAAAGAAGLIKAALSLHHKVIPPTIKVNEPLKEITNGKTPFYIPTEKRPWLTDSAAPRRAAISAFGFGGSNFHVLLEEYTPNMESIEWSGNTQLLAFSGNSTKDIETGLEEIKPDIAWDQLRNFAVKSREKFDPSANCRLLIVIDRQKTDIGKLVSSAKEMLKKSPLKNWNTPDGAYFGTGKTSGKIGILFPGQGSQYVGMLRDIACSFPEMLFSLSMADRNFQKNKFLSDVIYPKSPFLGESKEAQETALRDTAYAQPAIGAISLAVLRILESFGVIPAAVGGHSYGELTALCVAGRIDEETFHSLSKLRGQIMAAGEGDKGGMLAISADIETVEKILTEAKLDLVIANRNSQSQSVLSGSSSEIERGVKIFTDRKLSCKKLPVAAAFHSKLVADAAPEFFKALKPVNFHKGNIPVYSNTTATPYPGDAITAKELLANQLAKPVEFMKQVEAMYNAGIKTFIEAGPGAKLSGLVKSILGEKEHYGIAVDSSNSKRSGIADLGRTLAQLAALGYDIKLTGWDDGYIPSTEPVNKKPFMTIPLSGANYVKPKPKLPPKTLIPSTVATKSINQGTGDMSNVSVPKSSLAESLHFTRESIALLQKMQEETAKLHKQFLEGQEAATRTIQQLLSGDTTSLNSSVSHKISSYEEQKPVSNFTKPVEKTDIPAEPKEQRPVSTAKPADNIVPTLLAVVSEKTGYPVEMLDMEMGLDSDLGIDSIKRVEILSALQERLPDSPVIGSDQLGTIQTLGDIAKYLSAGAIVATVAAQTAIGSNSNIASTLLAVVSEKTGYPIEMLDMEMGLDSDLGIDSIKRVEILSALQERLPGSPVIGSDQLGTIQTLGDIAKYLDKGTVTAPTVAHVAAQTQTAAESSNDIASILLAVVSEKTGYPVEMLDMEMGLDSDLGIDSIKRVEILSALQERLPNSPVIGSDQLGTIQTLGDIAKYLAPEKGKAATPPVIPEIIEKQEQLPFQLQENFVITRSEVVPTLVTTEATSKISLPENRELWITDDDSSFVAELHAKLREEGVKVRLVAISELITEESTAKPAGLLIVAPETGTDDKFLEDAFLMLKSAAPSLKEAASPGRGLFATVSRLDGAFGFKDDSTIVDPVSGGLAGLAKTASREWPGVFCKAIDIGGFPTAKAAAEAISKELFLNDLLEAGLRPEGRYSLTLEELPPLPRVTALSIPEKSLIVVTGGGRGVTASAAIALAAASKATLLLLGRSPIAEEEPEWLRNLEDESVIKRGIMEHADAKLHPKEIQEEYNRIIAGRELRDTLKKIEIAGGKAVYRALDIRDSSQVKNVIAEARNFYGPIVGIVHGAGVLADRFIADKSIEQFETVYSTKVAGFRAIMAACLKKELRFIAIFSSTTGRLGRTGQVDYAVANEVLNKMAAKEGRLRPDCRVVSINWGPWDGGMVTPALKKVFSKEGVGLIDLKAGAEFLVQEISDSKGPVEIVAVAKTEGQPLTIAPAAQKSLKEALIFNLDIKDYPFLRSHVIDGKAVLPMAIIAEWLANGALHGNPGLKFHGFNDLRICKGVTFGQGGSIKLHIMAGKAEKHEFLYSVPIELISFENMEKPILHAKAEVVLATRLPEGIRAIKETPSTPYEPLNGGIYLSDRLFHGIDLQGIEKVKGCSAKGIAALVKSAPKPSVWIKSPIRSNWLTDPLVMDSAFQLMILWSFEHFGAGSLPCFAARYRQYQGNFPKEGAEVIIRIVSEHKHSATSDMEFIDRNSGKLIARLEGYECIIDPSLEGAFQRNQLIEQEISSLGAN